MGWRFTKEEDLVSQSATRSPNFSPHRTMLKYSDKLNFMVKISRCALGNIELAQNLQFSTHTLYSITDITPG